VTPVKNLGLDKTKDQKAAKNIVGTYILKIFKVLRSLFEINPKTSTPYLGFNAKVVLQVGDAKKRTNIGNVEMRNNLKYDADLGIDLVQDVNGYVFVLDNFIGAKVPFKKQYVTVLTNTLADNIARTEVQSDCVCELKYGLHAEEKCDAKETKLLPPSVS
jgi:hypothetical protein